MTNAPQQAKAPAFARQLETTPRAGAGAWAVRMEGIGKQYRLGAARRASDNLREDVTNALRSLVTGGAGRQPLFWALRGVDLEVARGESVGIIGRNGAGKSTLLKILSRITPPTTGEMRYRGRLASLLEVGTGFHRELTGRENIFLNGSILGMRRHEIARQFDAIVDFAGVEQFLDTPVKFYSSGMYVRLAFAVAAHLRTDILVVDEVLAVGDAAFQKKCLGKMQDAASDGRTVLFVSHNMGAIQNLCQRCILLQQGVVDVEGPTQSVLRAYMASNAHGPVRNLAEIPRERPPRGARINAARILNQQREFVTSIEFGKGIRIELEVELLGPPLTQPNFGVEVRDALGTRLSRLATKDLFDTAPPMHGSGIIGIEVPAQNLMPGTYYLTLGASNAGETADFLEDAIALEIVEPPAPDDRRPPRKDTPFRIALDSKWDFRYPAKQTGSTDPAGATMQVPPGEPKGEHT